MNRPLSPPELEILVFIARGESNPSIAELRNKSVYTVTAQVRDIFRVLGARNRAHAVAIAYHTGIFQGKGEAADE